MASKLPVLYCSAEEAQWLVESVPRHTRMLPYRTSDLDVEYIPARRCRDNCRFFEPGIAAVCSYWGGAVKSDGSDFCSKWEEE